MRTYIIPGYVFGVIYGLIFTLFRMNPKAGMTVLEHVLGAALVSFTIAGGIGAAAGFVLAFCVAARRRLKYGRSQVVRD